jgi:hypothetical protein
MDQKTFDGIVGVLQRGSGVFAQEYVQAFVASIDRLQQLLSAEKEREAQKAQDKAPELPLKSTTPEPKKV